MNSYPDYQGAMALEAGVLPRQQVVKKRKNKIQTANLAYDMPLYLFVGAFAALTAVSFFALDIQWLKILSRAGGLVEVFWNLSHLSFNKFHLTWTAFLETVSVSVLSTLYATLLGIALGALGARNITPFKPLDTVISALLSFLRAVPTQVWVLLVLVCLGFGPAPGIVGLSFHITAFLARVFAQSFEEVEESTIEALKATGANGFQIFFGAVLPASFTRLIAWSAMRFEITFSEASILGMVGAGGIGYTVMATMNSYDFGRSGTAILLIFLFAYGLELLLSHIKGKVKA